MGNFYELTQSFFVPILATIIFLLFVYSSHSIDDYIKKRFLLATYATVTLIIADYGQGYFSFLDHPTAWRMFFASLAYTCRVSVIYYILMIYLRKKSQRFRNLMALPIALTFIAAFSSFVTKESFYYTSENVIVRGPLISIPFIASAFYFVYILVEAIKSIRIGDTRETSMVVFFFVCSTVATLMEVYWDYRGIVDGLCILGNIFYFIFFLSDNYTHDRLTNAYTRDRLYQDFSTPRTGFGIIAFDVNDLKAINDRNGHLAGDEALKTVSDTITGCLGAESRLYRIGGDEFIVAVLSEDGNKVFELEKAIKEAISQTPYTVAVGSVISKAGEPLESAMSRADAIMYAVKGQMKAEKLIKKRFSDE